jgi:hypothetical protein
MERAKGFEPSTPTSARFFFDDSENVLTRLHRANLITNISAEPRRSADPGAL